VPAQVAVQVPRHEPRRRTVAFDHATHDDFACAGCHVTPVSLAPADSVRTCEACHADHHKVGRSCATCHRSAATWAAHKPPVRAHQACESCHTEATVARLTPTRSFCLACHRPDVDHYPDRECSTCHFQRAPAELAPLMRRSGPT